ncbi:MAG: hypothetical protein ACJ75J_07065 [Cytophagaceae bacterium]
MSRAKENISSNPATFKQGAGQRPNTHTRRDIKKMTTDRINPNHGPMKKSEGKK